MKRYYPVFLDIEGRKCVVAGGGEVAARKAKSLADAGARVKVVSPVFSQGILRLAKKGAVVLVRKRFQARDLNGALLAIACTDDTEVNERVSAAAKARRILVNVVDSPSQCDFIVPSVVSRGALSIAVCTSGVSPALSRTMREELEKQYGPGYGVFLDLMETARKSVVREVGTAKERKRIFRALTESDFVADVAGKPKREGKRLFERRLKELLSGA